MDFCLFVLTVAVLAFVPSGQASDVANRCSAQCRGEAELKRLCRLELNCDRFLPDWTLFLDCLSPCRNIGNNCFQRCAFKTDKISARCLRHCGMDDVNGDEEPLAPGDAGVNEVTSGQVDSAGSSTLCYKRCYDKLLNEAMNRVYTKRPPN